MPNMYSSFASLYLALSLSSIIDALPNPNSLTARDMRILTYNSLGDSFSAGPGAGDQIVSGGNCRRFTNALGPQVNADTRFLGTRFSNTYFDDHLFLACTADKIADAQSQIASISPRADMVTLTIGGNDVYFGSIINGCIYYFYPTTWTCQQLIDAATTQMNSQAFQTSLLNYYNDILTERPTVALYVLGYPQFFDAATEQCSSTCFAATPVCAEYQKLTPELRGSLNTLVVSLNNVIRTTVGKATPRPDRSGSITYVSTDENFEGHRFCEERVTEPDYNNADIHFFPFTWKRRNWLTSLVEPGNAPTDCPAKTQFGDYGERFDCDLLEFYKDNQTAWNSLIDNEAITWNTTSSDTLGTKTPEWAIRIFHPTQHGFADMVDALAAAYSASPAVATVDTSTAIDTSTIHTTAAATAPPACVTSVFTTTLLAAAGKLGNQPVATQVKTTTKC